MNSLISMHLKKGDNVMVITGKDKGKTGKVLRALPREFRVVVENVNVLKRHERPRKANQKGQIVNKTMPIHISNVMVVDPDSGRPTRVGKKLVGEKWVRVAKKSGKEI